MISEPHRNDETTVKEIRRILKALNPDLKRLLELTDDADETVLAQCVRSGARSLRMARRIVKKQK